MGDLFLVRFFKDIVQNGHVDRKRPGVLHAKHFYAQTKKQRFF